MLYDIRRVLNESLWLLAKLLDCLKRKIAEGLKACKEGALFLHIMEAS
jgi:hypothetical protein